MTLNRNATFANNANTFNGGLSITSGTLTAAVFGTVLGAGTITMANSTIVELSGGADGSLSTGLLATSGNGSGVIIRGNGNNNNYALTISGSGTSTYAGTITQLGNPNTGVSIIKTGTGTQIFTGSNTNGTQINGGILAARQCQHSAPARSASAVARFVGTASRLTSRHSSAPPTAGV